jgi:hypothetical protein
MIFFNIELAYEESAIVMPNPCKVLPNRDVSQLSRVGQEASRSSLAEIVGQNPLARA